MSPRAFVTSFLSAATLATVVGCGDSSDSTKDGSDPPQRSRSAKESEDKDSAEKSPDRSSRASEKDTSPTEPAPPSKKKRNGAQCAHSSDCDSDFCVFKRGGSLGMCTTTCNDDIDCDLGSTCVRLGDAPQRACVPE